MGQSPTLRVFRRLLTSPELARRVDLGRRGRGTFANRLTFSFASRFSRSQRTPRQVNHGLLSLVVVPTKKL